MTLKGKTQLAKKKSFLGLVLSKQLTNKLKEIS